VHGRYFRNANANSIIIKMFTTRRIIGHTGRQTMGIESHQETSGVLLSEKCVKSCILCPLAVGVHILEMNHPNFF
jgi:hypothetical protein